MSVLNRIEYAFKSGVKELWGSYGWGDLAKDVVMPKAEAYSKAVKAGLISAGKVGTRIATKLIPGYSAYSTVKDLWTFGEGFYKGWHSYGK